MAALGTGLLGAVAALILAITVLGFVLYLVPIPLWVAAWLQAPTWAC